MKKTTAFFLALCILAATVFTFPVSVTAADVSNIKGISADSVTLYENCGGYTVSDGSTGEAWYVYQYSIDRLKLTFKDGTKATYTPEQLKVIYGAYRNIGLDGIRNGNNIKEAIKSVKDERFDVKILITQLLYDSLSTDIKPFMIEVNAAKLFVKFLKTFRAQSLKPGITPAEIIDSTVKTVCEEIEKGKAAGSLSKDDKIEKQALISRLEEYKSRVADLSDCNKAFEVGKAYFTESKNEEKVKAEKLGNEISNVIRFVAEAFGKDNQLTLLLNELTQNRCSVMFISEFGCDEYNKYNNLYNTTRKCNEIIEKADSLNFDDLI